MRFSYCLICCNTTLFTLTSITAAFFIPLSGELTETCLQSLDKLLIPSGDNSIGGPSEDSFVRCIQDGIPFSETDFGETNTGILDDIVDEIKNNLETLFSTLDWLNEADHLSSPSMDDWYIPLPSPFQILGVNTMDPDLDVSEWANVFTLSMSAYMEKLQMNKSDALVAAENSFHDILIASVRGIILAEEDQPENYINIGIGDLDAYMSSLVDPTLLVTSISDGNATYINSQGAELLRDLIDENEQYANVAQIASQYAPMWLGGSPTAAYGDEANFVESDDLYNAAGLESGARVERDDWETLKNNFRRSSYHRYRKTVPMATIDYSYPHSVIDSGAIPYWADAVHSYLEDLYGGPEMIELSIESRGFCPNQPNIKDICVVMFDYDDKDNPTISTPVAGRCSLPGVIETFDQADCAQINSDGGIDLDTAKYACVVPQRVSGHGIGDLESDFNQVWKGMRWSGLVPGLYNLASGMKAQWSDPTCALFCTSDILYGLPDSTGNVNDFINDYTVSSDSDYNNKYWFGQVLWSSMPKPLLQSIVPHPGQTSLFVDYRDCLAPEDASYPIKGPVFQEFDGDIIQLDDSYLPLLKFMATIEHIQNLTTSAFSAESKLRSSSGERASSRIVREAIINDLNRIPSINDVYTFPSDLLTQVKAKADDLKNVRAFLANKMMDCPAIPLAFENAKTSVCRAPFGYISSIAWLTTLIGIVFLFYYGFAFKQLHYWRDRKGLAAFESMNIIDLVKDGDLAKLTRVLEYDPHCLHLYDTNENQAIHWAAFLGDDETTRILLTTVHQMAQDSVNHQENRFYMLLKQEQKQQKDDDSSISSIESMRRPVLSLSSDDLRKYYKRQSVDSLASQTAEGSESEIHSSSSSLRSYAKEHKKTDPKPDDTYSCESVEPGDVDMFGFANIGRDKSLLPDEAFQSMEELGMDTNHAYGHGSTMYRIHRVEGKVILRFQTLFMAQVPVGERTYKETKEECIAASLRNYSNQKNENGFTPLHLAVQGLLSSTDEDSFDRYLRTIDYLLDYRGDINKADTFGQNCLSQILVAMDQAAEKDDTERVAKLHPVVLKFLERGADPDFVARLSTRHARLYKIENRNSDENTVTDVEYKTNENGEFVMARVDSMKQIHEEYTKLRYSVGPRNRSDKQKRKQLLAKIEKTPFDYGRPRICNAEAPVTMIELAHRCPDTVKAIQAHSLDRPRVANRHNRQSHEPLIANLDRTSLSSDWDYAEWIEHRRWVFKTGERKKWEKEHFLIMKDTEHHIR